MHRLGRRCISPRISSRLSHSFVAETQTRQGKDGSQVSLLYFADQSENRPLPPKRDAVKTVERAFAGHVKKNTKVIKNLAVKKKGPERLPPKKNPYQESNSSFPLPYTRKIEGLIEEHDGTASLQDLEPPSDHKPVATLAHGLDRVLFNPGVHWLRDPRSRVYNFPHELETIPEVTDFAFERLEGFVKSSRDEDLWELIRSENCRFGGSTSSLTGILSHIYFLLSGNKPVDISTLSSVYKKESIDFTAGQRMPATVVFNYHDGIYTIDSASSDTKSPDVNILLWMGTLLEKYLTMPPEEFATYQRANPPPTAADDRREAYRYARSQNFVMRSQLDCHDDRLPGTGVFDIKTRACLPIRMDLLNFEENSGYLIRTQHGLTESFEREYYDLIRSAFLKYSFQARIGNMDGVLIAYHNTARMFGFQYVPLEEMDARLFGPLPGTGARVFQKCVSFMEILAEEIALCFPEKSVVVTLETGEKDLNVWVEPAEWHEDAGLKPLRQLNVTTNSFLGNGSTKKHRAFGEIEEPWTVHYCISRVSGDDARIREQLEAVKERQFRAYYLPSDVAIDDIEAFWDTLNFGGKKLSELHSIPLPLTENFQYPDYSINQLRSLARSGRKHTQELARVEAGKPKIVLGQPYDPALMAEISQDLSNVSATTNLDDSTVDAAVEAAYHNGFSGLDEDISIVDAPGTEVSYIEPPRMTNEDLEIEMTQMSAVDPQDPQGLSEGYASTIEENARAFARREQDEYVDHPNARPYLDALAKMVKPDSSGDPSSNASPLSADEAASLSDSQHDPELTDALSAAEQVEFMEYDAASDPELIEASSRSPETDEVDFMDETSMDEDADLIAAANESLLTWTTAVTHVDDPEYIRSYNDEDDDDDDDEDSDADYSKDSDNDDYDDDDDADDDDVDDDDIATFEALEAASESEPSKSLDAEQWPVVNNSGLILTESSEEWAESRSSSEKEQHEASKSESDGR
ncbi:mitochondrial protein Pet127-domain-containing protein [Mycena floridula]|nr:mitochondrial protein Pet127-domain-containing protein [Mycena floridula]